jgi:hypothetical protein
LEDLSIHRPDRLKKKPERAVSLAKYFPTAMSFTLEETGRRMRWGLELVIVRSLHGFGTKEQLKTCLTVLLEKNAHLKPWLLQKHSADEGRFVPCKEADLDLVIILEPTTGQFEVIIEFGQGLLSNFVPFLNVKN